MRTITYDCALCGVTVTEDVDENAALAKFQRDFPDQPPLTEETTRHVCPSCYNLIMDELGYKKATLQ